MKQHHPVDFKTSCFQGCLKKRGVYFRKIFFMECLFLAFTENKN